MTVEDFLDRLNAVRRSGKGWAARCPGHDDRQASLSITEGNDHRTLLYCHAGCEPIQIVSALGLTLKDLYSNTAYANGHTAPHTSEHSQKVIVAAYNYSDEDSYLLYHVVRFNPKGFAQRRPDGNGGWKWELNGVRRVLFNLPQIAAAVSSNEPIYIAEGEKDAESLSALGLCATTYAGGAGKWDTSYSETLRGAKTILLPDNDEAGRNHMNIVARSLLEVNARVKIVELPGLPEKGDVSDWLTAGGTKKELLRLAGGSHLVTAESLNDNRATSDSGKRKDSATSTSKRKTTVKIMGLAEWAETAGSDQVDLWEGTVPKGHLSCLAAVQKCGKSTLYRNLIRAVVTGSNDFLGRTVHHGKVILLPLEERPGDVIQHFRTMGLSADALSQIVIPTVEIETAYTDENGAEKKSVEIRVIRDFESLEEVIRKVRPVLVVMDPIVQFVRFTEMNHYDKTYRDLEPLLRLALVYETAILFTIHEGKSEKENVGHRAIGSTAIPAIVHTTISMRNRNGIRTLENEGRNVVSFDKLVLSLDAGTGILTAAGTLSAIKAASLYETLIEAAKGFDRDFTREELLEATEGRKSDKLASLKDALVNGDLFHVSGTGKKGDPKLYNSGSRGSHTCEELAEPEFMLTDGDSSAEAKVPPCYACKRTRHWRIPGSVKWTCGCCYPPVREDVEWSSTDD